jgi:hypothetical protein
MGTAKDLVTLSIVVGFGFAILTHANQASKMVGSVSGAWFNLIRTVQGRSLA